MIYDNYKVIECRSEDYIYKIPYLGFKYIKNRKKKLFYKPIRILPLEHRCHYEMEKRITESMESGFSHMQALFKEWINITPMYKDI